MQTTGMRRTEGERGRNDWRDGSGGRGTDAQSLSQCHRHPQSSSCPRSLAGFPPLLLLLVQALLLVSECVCPMFRVDCVCAVPDSARRITCQRGPFLLVAPTLFVVPLFCPGCLVFVRPLKTVFVCQMLFSTYNIPAGAAPGAVAGLEVKSALQPGPEPLLGTWGGERRTVVGQWCTESVVRGDAWESQLRPKSQTTLLPHSKRAQKFAADRAADRAERSGCVRERWR